MPALFWGTTSAGASAVAPFLPRLAQPAPAPGPLHASPLAAAAAELSDEGDARSLGSDAAAPNPIARTSARDPITAALTAPSNPSKRYYDVLRALVSAVRTQLLPLADASLFSLPPASELGPAFPESVRQEDPAYFHILETRQTQESYKNSVYAKGMRNAWAVVDQDKLFYAFDRKPAPLPAAIHREAAAQRSAAHIKQFGREPPRRPAPIVVVADRGLPAMDVAAEGEDERATMLRQTGFRAASTHAILGRQGRDGGPSSVAAAAGNAGIGVGAGGTSGPALAPDVMTDTLRWAEQQRIAQEHRRVRCEHILHLLSTEMAAEAARQKKLRAAAARFAASEARFRKQDGWESYEAGPASSSVRGRAHADAEAAAAKSGLDPRELTKSVRYRPGGRASLQGGKAGGVPSGARYQAVDLAAERFEVARERAESSDALMRVLEDYRLVPLSVAAQYLDETLRDVDGMYAELVSARAAQAGHALSLQELAAQMSVLRSEAEREVGEAMALEGESQDMDGEDGVRSQRQRRRGPVLPSAFHVSAGGAVPLARHDDVAELQRFGPARPGEGLSAFNLRPYLGRAAVREAATQRLPGLDAGFGDLAAAKAGALYEGLAHLRARVPPRDANQPEASPYAEKMSRQKAGPVVSGSKGGAVPALDEGEDGDGDKVRDKENGPPPVALAAAPSAPRPPRPSDSFMAKARAQRRLETRRRQERAAGGGSGAVAPPVQFAELETQLHEWRQHSRPLWVEQMQRSYDTTNMRESTGQMLSIVQRTPKDPPQGRYSHLTGRFQSAADLHRQLDDARKLASIGPQMPHVR